MSGNSTSAMSGTISQSSLSDEENKQAEEAKQRTLNILTDAVKKKDHLLVENPEDFSDRAISEDIPLISLNLVEDLLRELQKVTFARGNEIGKNWSAYVYPQSSDRTIYLCPPFWQKSELLGTNSRPVGLIHEVSHFLGYGHTIDETKDNGKKEHFLQRKLLPLAISNIETAFANCMNHKGFYFFGSYNCCGERARDSVCEMSEMSVYLRYLRTLKNNKTLGKDYRRKVNGTNNKK